MKNNLLCLFSLLVIVLIASCKKNDAPAPRPLTSGTFSGYLEAVHVNARTNKSDTSYESVTLTFSAANSFTIAGDSTVYPGTTSIQAAGHGTFALDGDQFMQFSDKSLPATVAANAAPLSKYHLNGVYICGYSSKSIFLLKGSADTLYLTYNLSLNQEPAN